MKCIIFYIHLAIGARAHLLSATLPDTLLTCQSGYTPSLTCMEPLPVDDACTCTCRNGVVYNTTQPALGGSTPAHPVAARPIEGKPCTGEIIIPWTKIRLPHKANTLEPSELVSNSVEVPEDSIFLVADADKRCQHFEVYIDDERVGETFGEGPLDDTECGTGENCMDNHGGSYKYFTLAKGQHKLGLKWIKVTEECKRYSAGVGSYKIYKPCPDTQITA